MDPERLLSLYERQSEKLNFAENLIPQFKACATEIGGGPRQTLRAICRWLDQKGVPPSHTPKCGAKWHHDRLSDYLYMDGEEPTGEEVQQERFKREGMRVAIRRMLDESRDALDNPPNKALAERWGSSIQWEQRVHLHERRTLSIAQKLRSALGK